MSIRSDILLTILKILELPIPPNNDGENEIYDNEEFQAMGYQVNYTHLIMSEMPMKQSKLNIAQVKLDLVKILDNTTSLTPQLVSKDQITNVFQKLSYLRSGAVPQDVLIVLSTYGFGGLTQ